MFFTVEQLELIRRLRNTGITSDHVTKAFDELEKIDFAGSQSNNNKPVTPSRAVFAPLLVQQLTSNSASSSTSSSTPSSSPHLDRLSIQTVPVPTAGPGASTNANATSTSTATVTVPTTSLRPLQILKMADTPQPALIPMLTAQLQSQLAQMHMQMANSANSSMPSSEPQTPTIETPGTSNNCASSPATPYPVDQGPPRPIRSQRTPMKEITTLDNPAELEEFMKQGEEACILDMKTFITQYSLRQTTVAMMTGVSQPYISKLLNGNHRELSLRCRKNIYCWYLNCRRHPEKLAAFLADPSSRLETNCDGELVPQRRERYVFRPILIRILEDFFTKTPFPDLARRVEIATHCNHVLQLDKKGVGLMPKEVVSPQVVSNWFANKRKELRRKSADNAGIASSNPSRNTDSVSLSSMSPPSRDEETSSTTCETGPSSPDPAPFDLSISADGTTPPCTIYPNMNFFSLAQRLGFNNIPLHNYDPTKMHFPGFPMEAFLNLPQMTQMVTPKNQ